MNYRIYAVYFSDKRIKIGISADAERRMRYYVQESRRNRVQDMTWWASKEFSKYSALLAERTVCRAYADKAISGHRERFEGGLDLFEGISSSIENMRTALAQGGEIAEEIPYQGIQGSWRRDAHAH